MYLITAMQEKIVIFFFQLNICKVYKFKKSNYSYITSLLLCKKNILFKIFIKFLSLKYYKVEVFIHLITAMQRSHIL